MYFGHPLVCQYSVSSALTEFIDKQNVMHLAEHVVKRVRGINAEADEDYMSVGICQWSKAVEAFLTSGVPQRQVNNLPVDFNLSNIIFK